MDRISTGLEGDKQALTEFDESHLTPGPDGQVMLSDSATRLALPERLFNLQELDVLYDEDSKALWTYMRPSGRPSFTPPMLGDFEVWQQLIGSHFGPGKVPLDYLVLGSHYPGVFCFGGDLELFQSLIRAGNRAGLARYGYRCVEILHRNMASLDLPTLTIGLVQGQALGGGFEALLSFDYIIAERGSTFGLPEIAFGLFPGMGAHAILSRRLGSARAYRMITGNETYSAEDMYDLGIVSQVVEPGMGEEAIRAFMAKSSRRHPGLVGARRAMRACSPVTLDELNTIVDHWADAAIQLCESDLKLMSRLASAQSRLARTA